MSTDKQRAELHKTIWKIADQLRGSVDGWEFKSYVLGTLFYRYISESITEYVNRLQHEAGETDFDYTLMSDEDAEYGREQIVDEKGYFIPPSHLFANVARNASADENLNETLSRVFRGIEASAQGHPSEDDLRGLFGDFLVDSTSLGRTVSKRNELLAKVLESVAGMDLGGSFTDHKIDAFGDAYEFLMQMYAAHAGKSGGEYFTPPAVSELLARLCLIRNPLIRRVYDPACGSGSLLLKFAKIIGHDHSDLEYYGQEINPSTYNLCRINMFLHGIGFDKFDIQLGDTLTDPRHMDLVHSVNGFDAIVSNPPYSIKWEGEDNPILINNERYAPAGILAPKSKADLAFAMHMYHHLSESGVASIVEFPGVLYRGGAEQKIRQYLVEHNAIDAVIQLPANLFFGVGIATCVLVLRKGTRTDNKVLFVDASSCFEKEGNKNYLRPYHQDRIAEAIEKREDEQYFCRLVKKEDILANDCNLSVSSYVEQEDTREVIDIEQINTNLASLIAEGHALNARIEEIIKELEG
ncbi:MAG: type I restriction-modification system subunit M [Bacteroidaceae bacterium]|nr:type I restriction-modification system subunit M [Bacteroidaceae bacterium]